MSLKQRNTELYKLYKKKTPVVKLSKKYNLTTSRIRQIIFEVEEPSIFCIKHKKSYRGQCEKCRIGKKYPKLLINLGSILLEVKKVKKLNNRKAGTVQRKKIIIKTLKDNYSLNFVQIGFIMEQDRTTIMHHYYNQ